MTKLQITMCQVPDCRLWLKERGGIAVWRSTEHDQDTSITPATGTDGKPSRFPHWSYETTPERIVTDAQDVEVVLYREVERLSIKLRNTMVLTLLSEESEAQVNKAKVRHKNAFVEFDYLKKECIISVPDKTIPLVEFV